MCPCLHSMHHLMHGRRTEVVHHLVLRATSYHRGICLHEAPHQIARRAAVCGYCENGSHPFRWAAARAQPPPVLCPCPVGPVSMSAVIQWAATRRSAGARAGFAHVCSRNVSRACGRTGSDRRLACGRSANAISRLQCICIFEVVCDYPLERPRLLCGEVMCAPGHASVAHGIGRLVCTPITRANIVGARPMWCAASPV